jgi:hypothetical protein
VRANDCATTRELCCRQLTEGESHWSVINSEGGRVEIIGEKETLSHLVTIQGHNKSLLATKSQSMAVNCLFLTIPLI